MIDTNKILRFKGIMEMVSNEISSGEVVCRFFIGFHKNLVKSPLY